MALGPLKCTEADSAFQRYVRTHVMNNDSCIHIDKSVSSATVRNTYYACGQGDTTLVQISWQLYAARISP